VVSLGFSSKQVPDKIVDLKCSSVLNLEHLYVPMLLLILIRISSCLGLAILACVIKSIYRVNILGSL
jgi:hypothetical protein